MVESEPKEEPEVGIIEQEFKLGKRITLSVFFLLYQYAD